MEVTKEELGQAMGQGERSCAAVCEEGLAALMLAALDGKNEEVKTEWQK